MLPGSWRLAVSFFVFALFGSTLAFVESPCENKLFCLKRSDQVDERLTSHRSNELEPRQRDSAKADFRDQLNRFDIETVWREGNVPRYSDRRSLSESEQFGRRREGRSQVDPTRQPYERESRIRDLNAEHRRSLERSRSEQLKWANEERRDQTNRLEDRSNLQSSRNLRNFDSNEREIRHDREGRQQNLRFLQNSERKTRGSNERRRNVQRREMNLVRSSRVSEDSRGRMNNDDSRNQEESSLELRERRVSVQQIRETQDSRRRDHQEEIDPRRVRLDSRTRREVDVSRSESDSRANNRQQENVQRERNVDRRDQRDRRNFSRQIRVSGERVELRDASDHRNSWIAIENRREGEERHERIASSEERRESREEQRSRQVVSDRRDIRELERETTERRNTRARLEFSRVNDARRLEKRTSSLRRDLSDRRDSNAVRDISVESQNSRDRFSQERTGRLSELSERVQGREWEDRNVDFRRDSGRLIEQRNEPRRDNNIRRQTNERESRADARLSREMERTRNLRERTEPERNFGRFEGRSEEAVERRIAREVEIPSDFNNRRVSRERESKNRSNQNTFDGIPAEDGVLRRESRRNTIERRDKSETPRTLNANRNHRRHIEWTQETDQRREIRMRDENRAQEVRRTLNRNAEGRYSGKLEGQLPAQIRNQVRLPEKEARVSSAQESLQMEKRQTLNSFEWFSNHIIGNSGATKESFHSDHGSTFYLLQAVLLASVVISMLKQGEVQCEKKLRNNWLANKLASLQPIF